MDMILNGQPHGDVASRLIAGGGDPRFFRPYLGRDGRSYITANGENGKPQPRLVQNANTTLTYDEWKLLDEAVIRAALPRLRIVAALRAAGLQYIVPQGMGKTVLLSQTQSDITDATVDMDGLVESKQDRPEYGLVNLLLPIVHKDFSFPARQILTSRNGANPLDTTMAELAARKVAEAIEKMALGVATGGLDDFTFGGGTIYGITDSTARMTKALTDPSGSTWTPSMLVAEILAMKLQSQQQYHYGPWMIFNATDWDQYLDEDYSAAKGDNTLRDRIKKIESIQDVVTVDYLPSMALVLVQMTADVIRMVVGMEITTLQWETHGGLKTNFKVMGINVPQIREDFNGNTGIVHGSVA